MRRRLIAMVATAAAVAALVLWPTSAETAHAGVNRISGTDRYDTSVQVSRASNLPLGGTIFIASGTGFADALAAAPVAAAERARLLLAPSDRLTDSVIGEIMRVNPTRVVLVGGEPSLSNDVLLDVQALVPSADVSRIAGSDRVATSMLLLDRLSRSTRISHVWAVSAGNFPDALAAGAAAASNGQGLVLTWGNDSAFQSMVQSRAAVFDTASIAGGANSVGTDVRAFLMGVTGGDVPRYEGSNRYETAVAINRAYTPTNSVDFMILASGETFPDGLVASTLSAAIGAPLYLTPAACAASSSLANEQRRIGASTTIVIGGTPSVSETAANLDTCAAPSSAAVSQMLTQVNQVRAEANVAPLSYDPALGSLAQSWSETMASNTNPYHNPNFCSVTFNLGYRACGENIAWGSSSNPATPMSFWTQSPGHYGNMTNARFTDIGIGVAQGPDGRWYWTQNFGG